MIRERKGFTLIELLVVIAIIAILAAVLFPIFAAARAKARAVSCQANMSQIAKAIISYAGDYDDKFPCTRAPGTSGNGLTPAQSIADQPLNLGPAFRGSTWVMRIDPYVQKGAVVDDDGNGPWLPGRLGHMSGVFNCSEREKRWVTGSITDYHSYGYNSLYLGLPYANASTTAVIGGGLAANNPYAQHEFRSGATRVSRLESSSDTLLLVENSSIWAFPPFRNAQIGQPPSGALLPAQQNYFISPRHGDKINVAYCDGHAKALNPAELVGPMPLKTPPLRGLAVNNKLWDPVKCKYP